MKSFKFLSLLGALAALGSPAPLPAAAEPLRLDRVGVVRFSAVGADRLLRTQGVLMFDGHSFWTSSVEIDRPSNIPNWAIDRTLVAREAWLAYRALGFNALANFQLGEFSVVVLVGTERFWAIEPNSEAEFSDGKVINISTRARLAGTGDSVIAGFVIEGRPRWVLIRGVGPSLTPLGVTGALPDPIIRVRRGQEILHDNDDWSTRPDAAEIRDVATRVGAFPLVAGGKDAALLVPLPPGAYTVSVESAGPAINGGDALVEVYSVPALN